MNVQRNSNLISIIFLSVFSFISIPVIGSDFEYGPFTASYYLENDGRSPGQGNAGDDLNIVPELIASEVTPYPSINYSWDNLYGINAYNFYSVWEGNIEVFAPVLTLTANFNVSWSDTKFYLNDELLGDWGRSDKDLSLTLSKGVHHIRIEHHNHWHTAGFNASFTAYPQLTVKDAKEFGDIELSMTDDTRVVYASAYEAGTRYNEVTVNIPDSDGSIVLFLGSRRAINWVINNPHNVYISSVVFNSYGAGTSIQGDIEAPVYHVTDFPTGYNSNSGNRVIQDLTGGRMPDYVQTQYYLSEITIPSFE